MSDELMTVQEMKDRALGFQIIKEEGTDYFNIMLSEFKERITPHLPEGMEDVYHEFIRKSLDRIMYKKYDQGYIEFLKYRGLFESIEYLKKDE
ncbi:MAG: hypothetical protein NZ820_07100 [Dehalococcoidia bacterium]|jgi:hypothetical protein|nr:hypothetical protein [Dehalococcoidia bacterium]